MPIATPPDNLPVDSADERDRAPTPAWANTIAPEAIREFGVLLERHCGVTLATDDETAQYAIAFLHFYAALRAATRDRRLP